MKRPSHYLLLFTVLFVTGYVAIDRWSPATPAPVPKRTAQQKKPESVKLKAPKPVVLRTPIKGRVFDPRGYLVVGAEVALPGGERSRTDADGAFVFDTAAPPPWDVSVAADGYRGLQQRLFPGIGDPLFLALEPAAPWDPAAKEPTPAATPELIGDGFVYDRSGKPLANAMVAVVGTELRARTDEIGHYRIPLPGTGAELVVSHPEAGLCCRSEPLKLTGGKGTVPLPKLVAEPGAAIRGTVCDAKGQPIEGVPLQLRGEGLVRTLESGRDGVFRVSGLLAGTYELVAMAWRGTFGSSAQVELNGSVADCDVHMKPAEERRLRIVDGHGQPLPRAYLATSVAGHRRTVARADEQGWVEVAAAAGVTDYEVRGDDLRAMRVTQDEADQLVVACPD